VAVKEVSGVTGAVVAEAEGLLEAEGELLGEVVALVAWVEGSEAGPVSSFESCPHPASSTTSRSAPIHFMRATLSRAPRASRDRNGGDRYSLGMEQPTADESWPTHCPECGTQLAQATVDFDRTNRDMPELNPGEMAKVDYCPNPDCPTNRDS
jgi:hypothetical protein